MVKITIPYLGNNFNIEFLLTKQRYFYNIWWRYGFKIHIFSSCFILLIGGLQFIPSIFRHYKTGHSILGKIYISLVLFLSAPGALIMSYYANGGIYAQISFITLSFLWIITTYLSYHYVIRKDFVKHIKYSILGYSLTLSAITLRIYVLLLSNFIHLPAATMYTLVAWLSWIPNLILAILLRNKIRNWMFGL